MWKHGPELCCSLTEVQSTTGWRFMYPSKSILWLKMTLRFQISFNFQTAEVKTLDFYTNCLKIYISKDFNLALVNISFWGQNHWTHCLVFLLQGQTPAVWGLLMMKSGASKLQYFLHVFISVSSFWAVFLLWKEEALMTITWARCESRSQTDYNTETHFKQLHFSHPLRDKEKWHDAWLLWSSCCWWK